MTRRMPGQITDSGQWKQKEPPEDASPFAFFYGFNIGRRAGAAIEIGCQPIPIGTICSQRVFLRGPSEKIVHIAFNVIHK
jgi:hypothetical protein